MDTSPNNASAFLILELKEFAGFEPSTQRYIRRSLDVALSRRDAVKLWSRNKTEITAIQAQMKVYEKLSDLRQLVPAVGSGLDAIEPFIGPLVLVTAFDLGQERLPDFSSYRFLYERLLGARTRQWLPSAFCAAAALPHLRPGARKNLLQSISEAAATAPGWSAHEPTFFPEWIKKEVLT
jgi:hypothetical protein